MNLSWLYNSWMTNPIFYGEMAHALGGYAAIFTASQFTKKIWIRLVVLAVFIGITAVKEFYYDTHFEIPVQDFSGGLRDFCAYQVGAVLGLVVGLVQLFVENVKANK